VALESISVEKHGSNDFIVMITDDGVEFGNHVRVPDPLPPEFANKKAFLKIQIKAMIQARREWVALTVSSQDADAAEFLTELQAEMD